MSPQMALAAPILCSPAPIRRHWVRLRRQFCSCGGETIRTRLAENPAILAQTVRYTYKRSHKIIIEPHSAPRDGDGGSEGDDGNLRPSQEGFCGFHSAKFW
jgi:hypothetical protein